MFLMPYLTGEEWGREVRYHNLKNLLLLSYLTLNTFLKMIIGSIIKTRENGVLLDLVS